MKKIIKNVGPYPLSKAIIHDHKITMEISGQIGVDPKKGELVEGIEKQTSQIIENIKQILEENGWNLTNVIKATIYLSDMKDYDKMNEVYGKYFAKDHPTRTTIAVKELPRHALVEITCTASGNEIAR